MPLLSNGKISLKEKGNKEIMFEVICNHDCLNPKSKDVREAFEELWHETAKFN